MFWKKWNVQLIKQQIEERDLSKMTGLATRLEKLPEAEQKDVFLATSEIYREWIKDLR